MKNVVFGAVALLALAGAAQAELVSNGGFETGDFTDWAQFGNPDFTGVQGSFGGTNPHGGQFQAFFGPVGSTGGISQTLAANPGDMVCVSFWLRSFGGTPNSFDATLDGMPLLPSLVDAGGFDYTLFTGTVTVTNANPLLAFSFRQDPSFWLLDDVSADLCNVVPLPPGAMIGMGGLAGIGVFGAARRRKLAKA